MKKVICIMLMVVSLVAVCSVAFADVYVHSYHRSDGSYVQGHYRSDPDGIESNNWSHVGNVNPHTGERGTRW